jgi:Capsule assembly protein Wzi
MRYLRFAMFSRFNPNGFSGTVHPFTSVFALGCAVVFAVVLVLAPAPAEADPIEPQHAVYGLLRRGEALGHVPLGFTALRPRDRSEVLAALQKLADLQGGTDMPNPTHTGPGVARMIAEAKRYLADLDLQLRGERSRLTYADTSGEGERLLGGLQADFLGSLHYLDSLPRPQAFSTGIFAVQAVGAYGDRLSLVSQAYLGMERSVVARFRENYDPSQGLPYNTDREGKRGIPRGVSTFDGFRAVIGYGHGPLRIEAGEDWNTWGPGQFSQTTLGTSPWFWVQDSLPASDTVGYKGTVRPGGYRRGFREPGEASPLPLLRLRFGTSRFEYVKLVAQRTALHIDSAAWMVAHRLVWRPTAKLSLGGTEMVMVGGRTPNLGYWLPLVPLKYAEHQYGDRDNIALGFDVTYRLPYAVLAYFDLLLDDFSGPPLDFWGNKYAFTAGIYAAALPQSMEATLEYTQVSPWFFTHLRPGTQMQSYGALLGSALPADSHRLMARLAYPWRPYADFMLEGYAMQRSVGDRPTSIFSVHEDAVDGTKRYFLGGPIESRQSLGLGTAWRYDRFAEVKLWAGSMWVSSWKGEDGKDLVTPWFHGTLHVTY